MNLKVTRKRSRFLLKTPKKTTATLIAQEFDKIRDALKQKEKELLLELEELFEIEEKKVDPILEKDKQLKEKFEAWISGLEDSTKLNARFFKILRTSIQSFHIQAKVDELSRTCDTTQRKNASELEAFRNSLIFIINKATFSIIDTSIPIKQTEVPAFAKTESDDISSIKEFLEIKIRNDYYIITPRNALQEGHNEFLVFPDLDSLKNITKVSIQFDGEDLTENHFQAVARLFEVFEKVTELDLGFNNQKCTDKHLSIIASRIWKTDKIELVIMNFTGSAISDLSLTDSLKRFLCKINNVKSFKICLNQTQISNNGIQAFASYAPSSFLNLTEFCLELKETIVSDSSIIELCRNLKQVVKPLKLFVLTLSGTQITDLSIETLAKENLCLMNNLQVLELYLCCTQVTDQGFEVLCEHLKYTLKLMKRIAFSLEKM